MSTDESGMRFPIDLTTEAPLNGIGRFYGADAKAVWRATINRALGLPESDVEPIEVLTLAALTDSGIWQEIHRMFLHPLGLTLVVAHSADGLPAFIIAGKPDHKKSGVFLKGCKHDLMCKVMDAVARRAFARIELLKSFFPPDEPSRSPIQPLSDRPKGPPPGAPVIPVGRR